MITAIILAAGQSKRMGQPKMLLPWGETTVLGQVIETIQRVGVDQIMVITGGAREKVEKLVIQHGLRVVHNEDYESSGMISSLQCGIRILRDSVGDEHRLSEAALICLGDQPQIREGIACAVVNRFIETGASLVIPSYRMRRGHPWLVSSMHWDEILQMKKTKTPRDFLSLHASEIDYISVDDPSVITDLDTFEDYLKSRP